MNFENKYVAQIDELDCGVAALSMILREYGSQVPLAMLRDLAKTNKEGTTAFGLKKAGEHFGLKVDAVSAQMENLISGEINYPFIAHVIKHGNLAHYYVILEVTDDYVVIADPDPDVKIAKLTLADFLAEWSGVALLFKPQSTYRPVNLTEKSSLREFLPLLNQHKKLLVAILAAAFCVTLISVVGSYFVQVLIDRYIPQQQWSSLSIVVLGLLVAYAAQAIFTYGQQIMLTLIGQKLTSNILLNYIKHVFSLPLSFFSTHPIGDVTARFMDAGKIIDALASAVVAIGLDLSVTLFMGVVLGIQSPLLFGITLLVLPVYAALVMRFNRPLTQANHDQMQSNAQLNATTISNLQGVETIKTLAAEDLAYQQIQTNFEKVLHKNWRYSKLDELQQALKLFIQLALSTIILWLGAWLVMQEQLTVGQLLAFNMLLTFFTNPLQNIVNLQPKLKTAQVANQRLNEVLTLEPEIQPNQIAPKDLVGALDLQNVSYHYGYGEDVLRDINLHIELGRKVAIVGQSGSGKSTLVKLLINFFAASTGKVLINNYDVSQLNPQLLRQTVMYIPPEPVIFAGTVTENLLMGNEQATMEDIERACKVAQIDREIAGLHFQYETRLDEQGSQLSSGQRQRLAIARALVADAPLLILDESTSSLDSITEQKLVDEILKLDKTVIFVAHRLSVAQRADEIIVLQDGIIKERGNHEELVAQKGLYYKMNNM